MRAACSLWGHPDIERWSSHVVLSDFTSSVGYVLQAACRTAVKPLSRMSQSALLQVTTILAALTEPAFCTGVLVMAVSHKQVNVVTAAAVRAAVRAQL